MAPDPNAVVEYIVPNASLELRVSSPERFEAGSPDGEPLPAEPASGRGRRHGTSSSEPFDRWFRYPAGFASDYVGMLLAQLDLPAGSLVLDPFAGSGVTGTSARKAGYSFFGIEAHPLIAELAQLKLQRSVGRSDDLVRCAKELAEAASWQVGKSAPDLPSELELTKRSFTPSTLAELVTVRDLIKTGYAGQWSPYLKWALLGTLRDVASVRVGWPYQSPGKARTPRFSDAIARFGQRVQWIAKDLQFLADSNFSETSSQMVHGDSRTSAPWAQISPASAGGCISSPPYLNNFDYADATRLELYFWGEVRSWSEMCSTVRSGMLTATTQQSSVGAARSATELLKMFGSNITEEIEGLIDSLQLQRTVRSRGKEYDRVVPDYFAAIGQVLMNLSSALAPNAPCVWLVGDSAPYGVYVNTPKIISRIAETVGLATEDDIPLRVRGKRWTNSNSRHSIELSERLLLLRRK